MWNKIKEYQQEGLSWGEYFLLEPVAYGIKKLVMTATIVDSLLDDITENIEVDHLFLYSSVCMYAIDQLRLIIFLQCMYVFLYVFY